MQGEGSSQPAGQEADLGATQVRFGSSFVDAANPLGPLGNPFAVGWGREVRDWDHERRRALAQHTGTPETAFVHSVRNDVSAGRAGQTLTLSVCTPTGKELAVCVHGFIGAVHALSQAGLVDDRADLRLAIPGGVQIPVSRSADGAVLLHLVAQRVRRVTGLREVVGRIFGVPLPSSADDLPVLSVGSAKLTVEVSPGVFDTIRQGVPALDFARLLALQERLRLNGVHIFSRNPDTLLPEHCMQANAFLGPDLVVDRATGVSIAAQVSADTTIQPGQQVTVTQWTHAGPSAKVNVTKGSNGSVQVGGNAIITDPPVSPER